MEGSVLAAGEKESSREAPSRKQLFRKPPRRRLLRRRSSNAVSEAPAMLQPAACVPETSKQQLQRPRSYPFFSSLSDDVHGSPPARRFTPPLSPSLRSSNQQRTNDDESKGSAAASIAMLKRPGVPALTEITELKRMVGAAPRPWVLDFKIRGGRSHVNAKLREMEVMETDANARSPLKNIVPKFLKRQNSHRTTQREVVEAREELMQVLTFLHLRE